MRREGRGIAAAALQGELTLRAAEHPARFPEIEQERSEIEAVERPLRLHFGLRPVLADGRKRDPSLEGRALEAGAIERDLDRSRPHQHARGEILQQHRSDPALRGREAQIEVAAGQRRQGDRPRGRRRGVFSRTRAEHLDQAAEQGREIQAVGGEGGLDRGTGPAEADRAGPFEHVVAEGGAQAGERHRAARGFEAPVERERPDEGGQRHVAAEPSEGLGKRARLDPPLPLPCEAFLGGRGGAVGIEAALGPRGVEGEGRLGAPQQVARAQSDERDVGARAAPGQRRRRVQAGAPERPGDREVDRVRAASGDGRFQRRAGQRDPARMRRAALGQPCGDVADRLRPEGVAGVLRQVDRGAAEDEGAEIGLPREQGQGVQFQIETAALDQRRAAGLGGRDPGAGEAQARQGQQRHRRRPLGGERETVIVQAAADEGRRGRRADRPRQGRRAGPEGGERREADGEEKAARRHCTPDGHVAAGPRGGRDATGDDERAQDVSGSRRRHASDRSDDSLKPSDRLCLPAAPCRPRRFAAGARRFDSPRRAPLPARRNRGQISRNVCLRGRARAGRVQCP